MKRAIFAILLPFAIVGTVEACTPGQRSDVRSALDVVQVACIIANQTMSDSKIAEICHIAGPFFKPMQDILASARNQTALAAKSAGAAQCGDAGAR